MALDFVAQLEMQVRWFGMKAQVDTISIGTNDVFSTRILVVSSRHQLLHSRNSQVNIKSNPEKNSKLGAHFSKLNGVTISGKVKFWAMDLGTPT